MILRLMVRRGWWLVLILSLLVSACSTPYEFKGVVIEEPRQVYDVSGTDESGSPFLLSNYTGKYVLVNFGYTFCPDICPLTLSELAKFQNDLAADEGALAEKVQVLFVTVDPERDTVDRLEAYMAAFHDSFHGVHIGDPDALDLAKQSFGVFSETVPIENNPDGYLVNHTGGIFVLNPSGKWIHFFPHDVTAADLLADMIYLLKS